ncbi:glycosyltransferase family 2 protein [Methylobacterium radiotolerans]|uniref:glycosyltransferase family 2 protein n=1 Tax=Methylobacterium radiotolerans TaxID=31998 RepID=UPI001F492B02|nr:glycosyltransferase family 2 protein [Methylobacterium radiotolerans]UIY43296.1 glycosyltransferase [Methylobacterium radiotolerans]
MPLPLVSLIVPTLNRLELLAQTLSSVSAQDYGNLELIISDNASTDATGAFLAQLRNDRLTVLTRSFTLPMEANVTDAVQHARGKYMLLLSDDDLISNTYVSTMVAAFEADDAIQVGLGRRVLIDGASQILHQAEPLSAGAQVEAAEPWLTRYFASPTAHTQINTVFSTFYRRSAWLDAGGQPTLSGSYFSDTIPFVGVLNRASKVFYAPEAVFLYRLHQNQESHQATAAAKQAYAGMFQFFEQLKPKLGDLAHSDALKSALIRYVLMMFFNACGPFATEQKISAPDLYGFFWDALSRPSPPEAGAAGPPDLARMRPADPAVA